MFSEMTPIEKLNHCERCISEAKTHLDAWHGPVYLADILDVWDYWTPYLIARLRKLESVAVVAKRLHEGHVESEVYSRHGARNPLAEVLAALEVP